MKYLKIKLTLLTVLFLTFTLDLSAEYLPDRYAYPAICIDHFDNNIATKMSWLECADSDFVNSLRKYFKHIPTPYEPDCYGCSDCEGLSLDMYNDFEWPTDIDAFDEVWKGHQYFKNHRLYSCDNENDHCEDECWDGGYFRKWNHKYSHFFRHYLTYCAENSRCCCYWPEESLKAVLINDKVFSFVKTLCSKKLIDSGFSPYWTAKQIEFDYHQGKCYMEEYHPSNHGMASSLTTYTFFYSQYYQTLLSTLSYADSNYVYGKWDATDRTYDMLEQVRDDFLALYSDCLKKHPHPKIYYERGMIHMHSGNTDEALQNIADLMKLAKSDKFKDQDILTSEMYQQEAEAYAEIGRYDKAIESLNNAIAKDPENFQAYFERASAYFETGDFDKSLQDYLHFKKKAAHFQPYKLPSNEFIDAFSKAAFKGCREAAEDFFPSLCHTAFGLGQCLWTFGEHPIDSTDHFASICYEMGTIAVEYLKTVDKQKLHKYADELVVLYERFSQLNDKEKGELIGYIVGKYGTDIYAGVAIAKGIAAFKNLREANRICNFEAAIASPAAKAQLLEQAAIQSAERAKFFENCKIHWGQHR